MVKNRPSTFCALRSSVPYTNILRQSAGASHKSNRSQSGVNSAEEPSIQQAQTVGNAGASPAPTARARPVARATPTGNMVPSLRTPFPRPARSLLGHRPVAQKGVRKGRPQTVGGHTFRPCFWAAPGVRKWDRKSVLRTRCGCGHTSTTNQAWALRKGGPQEQQTYREHTAETPPALSAAPTQAGARALEPSHETSASTVRSHVPFSHKKV